MHKNVKIINTTKIILLTAEFFINGRDSSINHKNSSVTQKFFYKRHNQPGWRAWMHWTRWLDTILTKVHLAGCQMLCFSA